MNSGQYPFSSKRISLAGIVVVVLCFLDCKFCSISLPLKEAYYPDLAGVKPTLHRYVPIFENFAKEMPFIVTLSYSVPALIMLISDK